MSKVGTLSYLKSRKKQLHAKRDYMIGLKATTPCKDCGKQYDHWIMEFDHVGEKRFHPSACTAKGWGALKAEIAKCEIVCANCHNDRTHKRGQRDKKRNYGRPLKSASPQLELLSA